MPPVPTMGLIIPPVMDSIYKKYKDRKVSLGGPAYVMEARQKSASLSSLIAEEEKGLSRKVKSKSEIHVTSGQDEDDLALHRQHRHSEMNVKKKHVTNSVFDYNRILKDEQNEFEFRLSNTPQASGQLSDFLVLKKLASGQFGRVFLAEDKMDKKQFAIKAISKDVILRNNLLTDVEAERDYLYATNSPFIVSLIQHFEDPQCVYFVQEYVSNGDMYDHLKQSGSFSEDLTRFYTAQVVLALEYMHNVKLVYRDLKPENVMIDSNGYIKLVDFGFVKRVERKTNTMVGTPAYMAPEMIHHKSYDKTVDWWSLGILVYEMLSGCQITPFSDSNRMAMYQKILSKEVTFPSSNRFPHSAVRDLIKRLLRVNPAQRLGVGINGSTDVKNHLWFASIKWMELYRRTLKPPTVRRSSILSIFTNNDVNNNHQAQPSKYPNKVSALKQSLLRGGKSAGSTYQQQPDTIQSRLRLEKILKLKNR